MSEIVRKVVDFAATVRMRRAAIRAGKPIVGYIGWAGKGNLGDDAMFEAARAILPHWTVVPYDAPQRERLLERFGLSGPRCFQSVILGGGTLISPAYFPPVVGAALEQGLAVWSLGTGVGSSGFEMAADVDLADWEPLLRRMTHLGVRGKRSSETLMAMGIAGSLVVGDLALSLVRGEPTAPARSFLVNIAGSPETALEEKRLSDAMAPTLSRLLREGWSAVPIAMTESDIAPTERLMRALTTQPPPVVRLTTARQFLDTAAPCAFTVSVRLHGAVLSCCAGAPPIMLGYRDKCLDFMESMDLEDLHIPWETITETLFERKVAPLEKLPTAIRRDILRKAQSWKDLQAQYVASIK